MTTSETVINLDAGEDSTFLADGREQALYRWVTRINIACGGHAGDEGTMLRSLELAAAAGIEVGAHPSYPDRAGFGRKAMALPAEAIRDFTSLQVETLARLAQRVGMRLRHAKPHGALYNQLAGDAAIATAFAEGVARIDPDLALVGLAGSRALAVWQAMGRESWGEAFADRAYRSDGTLVPRGQPGAVLTDPAAAVAQVRDLVENRQIRCLDGKRLALESRTICVHGDNPAASAVLEAIRAALPF
jgi:UPF0271 protein